MNDNPICFFDSGIGGSTILKEVLKSLPNESYIYYADSINNPYGNKTRDELFSIVDDVVNKLLKFNPKAIVCACNTATAMVLNDIRKKYPDVLFIGTEPAVKVVFDKYRNKKTIVITTKGTGESERFRELLNKYGTPNCELVMAPELAGLIENNKDSYSYLFKLLKKYTNVDVVVLGCTHFPLVKNEIKSILGDVLFVDGSIGVAKRLKALVNESDSTFSLKVLSTSNIVKERIISIIGK